MWEEELGSSPRKLLLNHPNKLRINIKSPPRIIIAIIWQRNVLVSVSAMTWRTTRCLPPSTCAPCGRWCLRPYSAETIADPIKDRAIKCMELSAKNDDLYLRFWTGMPQYSSRSTPTTIIVSLGRGGNGNGRGSNYWLGGPLKSVISTHFILRSRIGKHTFSHFYRHQAVWPRLEATTLGIEVILSTPWRPANMRAQSSNYYHSHYQLTSPD